MKESFSEEELRRHLAILADLREEAPLQIAVTPGNRGFQVDLYSFDAPGLFSFITGGLGAAGLNLTSGHVYTTTGTPSLIFDTFYGEAEFEEDAETWAEETMDFLYRLLSPLQEPGRSRKAHSETLELCRQNVIEAVADRKSVV
jgi:UTP:GlnB (protein PII) uridylyltransferase